MRHIKMSVDAELLRALSGNVEKENAKLRKLVADLKRTNERYLIELKQLRHLGKRVRSEESLEKERERVKTYARTVSREAVSVINRINALKKHRLQYHMSSKGWTEASRLSSAVTQFKKLAKI